MKVPGLFSNAQRTIEVPEGSVVFHKGDAGAEMYGVIEGEIELRDDGELLRTMSAEDVFGEMALIDSSTRSATAVAVRDSVLAVIDRRRFLFLVQETPMFALQVMGTMAARLRGDAS